MAIDSAARERLDEAMNERRLELGLTWRQVATAGDISYETLRAARRGDADIPIMTLRAIDRGLLWTTGSARAVLDGGEPTPQTPPSAAEVAEGQLQILSASPQQLVGLRNLVEEVLGREEADKFMARAIAMREDRKPDTGRSAS